MPVTVGDIVVLRGLTVKTHTHTHTHTRVSIIPSTSHHHATCSSRLIKCLYIHEALHSPSRLGCSIIYRYYSQVVKVNAVPQIYERVEPSSSQNEWQRKINKQHTFKKSKVQSKTSVCVCPCVRPSSIVTFCGTEYPSTMSNTPIISFNSIQVLLVLEVHVFRAETCL